MPSTDIYGTMPGMRSRGERVIRIAPDGAGGSQSFGMLTTMLGTCGSSTVDGPAWASLRGDQSGSRFFSAPADFMDRLGDNTVVLADGVTARVINVDQADCVLSGPGARFLAVARGNPGLRQTASGFPSLHGNWLAAIEATQRNGRFLRPGATAEAATQRGLPPVAAAKPSVSSPAAAKPALASPPSAAPRAADRELALFKAKEDARKAADQAQLAYWAETLVPRRGPR